MLCQWLWDRSGAADRVQLLCFCLCSSKGGSCPGVAAVPSDNSCSLSDAEGACQPGEDKKGEVICNCVIKWLLCLPGSSCRCADGPALIEEPQVQRQLRSPTHGGVGECCWLAMSPKPVPVSPSPVPESHNPVPVSLNPVPESPSSVPVSPNHVPRSSNPMPGSSALCQCHPALHQGHPALSLSWVTNPSACLSMSTPCPPSTAAPCRSWQRWVVHGSGDSPVWLWDSPVWLWEPIQGVAGGAGGVWPHPNPCRAPQPHRDPVR